MGSRSGTGFFFALEPLAVRLACMAGAATDQSTIHLPDGTVKNLPRSATGLDLAKSIGEGLARAAVAVEFGGQIHDIRTPLPDGAEVRIITDRDDEALAVLRHSASHVMAEAVVKLWPGTKVTIGPAIENGFYYDFDFPEGVTISETDLAGIEAEMKRMIKEGREWQRWEMPRDEAIKHFEQLGETYKVELIKDLPEGETISFYRQGEFTDLCRGPHMQSAKPMKAVKVMHTAGAYWRGKADNKMLTRIYGTAFFSKADLAAHLENLERARKNDHRRLGTQLDLFSFNELSAGSPFWHPRGFAMWNAITEMWRDEHQKRGYREVKTPVLYSPELWKRSGHWDQYRENMFLTELDDDGHQYGIKPMNCPAHALILKQKRLSWRDLPVRMNEQGLVHRFEPSGVLHGLMRVRHITQDDAHIFCTEDQVLEEVSDVLDFVKYLYKVFGFNDYTMELSTRPEKAIGSDEMWQRAEKALADALTAQGIDYKLNPGDGAFYGPKIDFHIRDSMGRTWQCGTVQLDFSMPSTERFDLTYTGEDNSDHHLVVIHRAILGSMERFIGTMLEHYAGEFPIWLAPVQATVITVGSQHSEYADTIVDALKNVGIRADSDCRSETIGRKIRDNEKLHTPVLLVVGDSEVESNTVSVRRRGISEQVSKPIDEVVAELVDESKKRTIGPHVKV